MSPLETSPGLGTLLAVSEQGKPLQLSTLIGVHYGIIAAAAVLCMKIAFSAQKSQCLTAYILQMQPGAVNK